MEKFAVDLDAVLDEFEFHEDQANQSQLRVSPSVSGFYSPCSGEPARSSLDLIPVDPAETAATSTISAPSLPSCDTRYDAPFSIDSPTAPTDNADDEPQEDATKSDLTQPNDKPDPVPVSPTDVFFDDKPKDTHAIEVNDGSDEKPADQQPHEQVSAAGHDDEELIEADKRIDDDGDDDDTSGLSDTRTVTQTQGELESVIESNIPISMPPILVSFPVPDPVPDSSQNSALEKGADKQVPDSAVYVPPVPTQVEMEEGQTKTVTDDNFEDVESDIATNLQTEEEQTVSSTLDQPAAASPSHSPQHAESPPPMPHSPSPQVHSEEPSPEADGQPDADNMAKFPCDDYVDMSEVDQYLKELEDEKSLISQIGTQEETGGTDDTVETGARPKQRTETCQSQETGVSGVPVVLPQDCFIPESELQQTIMHEKPESPPPYSEVDPNSSKPSRPLTLDLEGSRPDTDDSPVSAGDSVLGAPGETPANPSGPRLGQANILDGLSEDQLMFGKVQPFWVPDADATSCMICSAKFTVVKRRHHCRSCGKVLCSNCCNDKFRLVYMEGKEGRVCTPCKTVLERLERAEKEGVSPSAPIQVRQPNPANPMEYCSRIPVSEQVAQNPGPAEPPSVMVPVGVLKRNGATADASNSAVGAGSSSRQENKSVMFSDGIRPGGDLTELDGGSEHRPLGKRPGKNRPRRARPKGPAAFNGDVCKSKMPPTGLPFVSGKGKVEDEEIAVWFSAGTFVNFVLNNNLTVLTKKVHYAPINKPVWNFASRGLTSVGQDEVVILLEVDEDEALPPRDIYVLIQTIYEQAGAGRPLLEMGHVTVDSDYLGSNDHGGWLFIRHTFQAVSDLFLPNPPVLFGILVMRTEIPWARVFPLRLMLRLGAEYRYYPSPLVSTRYRKPVYREIGHTIMNVLADFKNYAYTLPTIRGLVIHMSPAKTVISIPKNRHEAVSKALSNSNDPVLALGANFSMSVDSHLVAIQGDDGTYQTQAINILHKERVVTGASFVVFNGSLKSTSNLTAKSSIVEDGIMVQVLPDHMLAFRKKLQDMEDVEIGCGPVGAPGPDETVIVKWVDEDKAINIGIKSVIDGKAMDGVPSLRIHSGPDIRADLHLIRWTELFVIKHEGSRPGQERDPTRIAESIARAVGAALVPHLNTLKEENCTPLAVRVTLDPDNVSYEAGADGKNLSSSYMNNLDSELVPLLHSSTTNLSLVLELVFHILDT